jgi:hypothetical protein
LGSRRFQDLTAWKPSVLGRRQPYINFSFGAVSGDQGFVL